MYAAARLLQFWVALGVTIIRLLTVIASLPADPAAEHFNYPVAFDIRDLVSLEDVMDELKLGPNG